MPSASLCLPVVVLTTSSWLSAMKWSDVYLMSSSQLAESGTYLNWFPTLYALKGIFAINVIYTFIYHNAILMIGKCTCYTLLSTLQVMHRHAPIIHKKSCLNHKSTKFIDSFIDFNGSNLVLLHPDKLHTCTVEWVLLFQVLIIYKLSTGV